VHLLEATRDRVGHRWAQGFRLLSGGVNSGMPSLHN
jgi:hypothetical protein